MIQRSGGRMRESLQGLIGPDAALSSVAGYKGRGLGFALPARLLRAGGATGSAFVVLLILVGLFAVITPRYSFISTTNISNIILDNSTIGLIVVGQTLVMVTAGIDLSVGSVLVLAGVVAGLVMGDLGGAPQTKEVAENLYPNAAVAIPAGIGAGIGVGVLAGAVNGLVVAFTRVPPFIVTLGMLGVALGIANILTGGVDVYTVPQSLQNNVTAETLHIPNMTLIAVAVAVIGYVWLSQSKHGRYLYAIGSGPVVARRAGISVRKHLVAVYVVSGTLAALAGVLDLARFHDALVSGYSLTNLDSVSAAVIGGVSLFGGRGTIAGAVVGTLIAGVLVNGFVVAGLSSFWQQVVIGVVVVVAVLLDELRRGRATK